MTTAVKSKPPDKPDQQTADSRSPMDQIPDALKNNTSICITPASKVASAPKPPDGTNNAPTTTTERPPRPPTVDLTSTVQDGAQSQPPPLVPAASLGKTQTCHTCNKHFNSFFALNTHIGKVHAGAAAQKIQFKLVLFTTDHDF